MVAAAALRVPRCQVGSAARPWGITASLICRGLTRSCLPVTFTFFCSPSPSLLVLALRCPPAGSIPLRPELAALRQRLYKLDNKVKHDFKRDAGELR